MTQWGLDTLFNPAKRHMDEEKQRQQSTREEVGDNSGGKRIDLESGRVTIRRAEDEGDNPGQDDEAGVGEAAGDEGAGAPAGPEAAHPRRAGAGGAAAAAASTGSTASNQPEDGARPARPRRPRSEAQRRAALRRGLDPDR